MGSFVLRVEVDTNSGSGSYMCYMSDLARLRGSCTSSCFRKILKNALSESSCGDILLVVIVVRTNWL